MQFQVQPTTALVISPPQMLNSQTWLQ